MSNCIRHKIRSRKDCPDCFPLSDREKKIQTSREMLAELDNMEQEEKNLVIKAPRKKRIAKIKEETVAEVISEIPVENEIPVITFKDGIEIFIKERLSRLKDEVRSIVDISYEYEYIDESKFKMNLIDSKAKDGWKFKEILTGNIAKLFGYNNATIVFERIKKK